MPDRPRIGIQIGPDDPFWVQVREVIWQRAQACSIELVEIAIHEAHRLTRDEQIEAVEDLVVQEIDALILNTYPAELLVNILDRGIPIIYVSEIVLRHPRFTSRLGLYDAGLMLGRFAHERLAGRGTLLIVGGLVEGYDNGQSRIDGFYAGLPAERQYNVYHVPSEWMPGEARPQVAEFLAKHPDLHIDAIFGLSDPLALFARDICQSFGSSNAATLVLGVNGDPLALVAIAAGIMTATVETDVDDIAAQAVDLAYQAARGEPLPAYFHNRQRLVTAENIAAVATHKLISLAGLPTRLVGVNRRAEQQRVVQLETSLAINRQVGLILDKHRLSLAITALIRDNYGFNHAQFLLWDAEADELHAIGDLPRTTAPENQRIDPRGPLGYALAHNQVVFVPNAYASHRFAPDPFWPETRARVVVPVHLGGQIMGLLDLHSHRATHRTREELDGLQLLADQLGISMRTAELYGEALEARATAEKADRLKTGLLANVSHELRTPLNVILGYGRAALDALAGGAIDGAELGQDLAQIYRSGEHLLRLINDLLDLSRAEIDELDLLPETIDTYGFLSDVFRSSADSFGTSGLVTWQLDLPPDLPPIEADPVRLRQVLLNLLHNAHKFTQSGQITLGAEVTPTELHLWVADTGAGIAGELQLQIFEPFVSADPRARRHEGIGLGLSISRRLVALHHGRMALESQPGGGSTFHIYLPLPKPRAVPTQPADADKRALALITAAGMPAASLIELAERRGLTLHLLQPGDDVAGRLAAIQPALLAWDLATAAEGRAIVEQIRALPQLGQLPMLLYQGEADTALDTAGAATGLLLKPLGDSTLIETLQSLDPHQPHGSILIVEDDHHIRALHRRVIAGHFPAYHIREADDGRAALEILAREMPSMIMLDLMLPEVDGFGVLEALRATPRGATVPVLVLSGRALSADDIRRLGEARVIFQTKDVLAEDELAEALRRTLDRDEPLAAHTSALVKRAIGFIQQHYDEPLSRQAIADAVGVSKDYLGRIFHQELGLSPWEYLIRYRVLRAKELLQTTSYSVAEIATRVGFDSATYFSHIFHREAGCSPRAFRAQQS
jgi:signal transduction histidine kinase/ABC-type sugar transport system substrate-binding protein/AraC-like DNA-binding protein